MGLSVTEKSALDSPEEEMSSAPTDSSTRFARLAHSLLSQ